jgi:hypothetical protein
MVKKEEIEGEGKRKRERRRKGISKRGIKCLTGYKALGEDKGERTWEKV